MSEGLSMVQAVYGLTTDGWTSTKLRAWLRNAELQPLKRVHRSGTELRYRIEEPERFTRFTTKVLPGGIHLVLGWI